MNLKYYYHLTELRGEKFGEILKTSQKFFNNNRYFLGDGTNKTALYQKNLKLKIKN